METLAGLKTTPLLQDHKTLHAKLGPFAGWEMPIQYEGILSETLYTRKAAACFDTCHMGEFFIKGNSQKSNLDAIVTARLKDLTTGSCRYASMLNKKGGIIDDLLVYRRTQEEWFLVVNAGNIEKDKKHFLENLSRDAEVIDLSGSLGKIDLQGPLAREVLRTIAPKACGLDYYTFTQADILGERNIISRTGYTGELGFEIYASSEKISSVWQALLSDKRAKPAGLGARDILRLEMAYSLYGQDIDEESTPLETGLEKFVDFDKDFIGKDALLKLRKSGLRYRRIFFQTLSRRSPRHNHKIFLKDSEIGLVTSGTFSPHLECGIGMGNSKMPLLVGQNISVGDENLKIDAVVTDRPFVKNTSLKNSGKENHELP
jgi:aminomethyltransferase